MSPRRRQARLDAGATTAVALASSLSGQQLVACVARSSLIDQIFPHVNEYMFDFVAGVV